MMDNYYIEHYFNMPEFLKFFGVTFGTLLAAFLFFYVYTGMKTKEAESEQKTQAIWTKWNSLTERFYEMIFSGTSILFFIAVYYLTDRFLDVEPFLTYWNKYQDFLLLLLIIVSVLLNNFLDHVLIRTQHLTAEEKTSTRIMGMIYMIMIFVYIKFIDDNNNYNVFISYFLGLMIGRFVYFDASWKDFAQAAAGVFRNIPMLIVTLLCAGGICLYGFESGYLIRHNGFITNVFIAHLFMCACIFLLSRLHFAEQIFNHRRKRKAQKEPAVPCEAREDTNFGRSGHKIL